MATYNLRRFSHPDGLKAIAKERLLTLLAPHGGFLSSRGVTLPPSTSTDSLDYETLVNIFMSPDADTPKGLADALYFIHEMATTEGMDELLNEAEKKGLTLDGNPDPTPADVAVQVWLKDKDLLERKHAEQYLIRPRSFEYYQTSASPVPDFKMPNSKTLKALQGDLDNWFEKKKRGRGSRVFVYPKGNETWFLVRHGEPYKREGSIEGEESSSVFYRPEKHDVLVYVPSLGEFRMNASSKGEKELYRKQFGLHLFGSEDFFPGTGKYTLDPLWKDGPESLACTDIEGMEWVKLIEVQFFWGGTENEIETRKADDVFAAFEGRKRSMPTKVRITRARFQVKFTDSNNPRTVAIRPSNIAQYTRDHDSTILEEWLLKRKFIKTEEQENS